MIRFPSAARSGRSFVFLAAAGCLFSHQALSQQAGQPIALDTIVVSPTALPTPIDQIASSVTVITADQIDKEQRRTLPQALADVPGLNIVQTGGPGGLTSIFMRGTNSNHVKVLIDGIDVGDPSTPNRTFDFGQMLTNDIERIEVLRGPQSGLYGADAIGGVIAITTKKGNGPPKVTGTLEGGSYGTFNQTLGLSGGNDRFDYAFNVGHFRSDSTPVTPPDLVAPGRRRNADSYDNWTTSAKLGAALTDNFRLNWVGRFTDGYLLSTGDDFNFPSAPNGFRSSQDYRQAFTRGEAVWDLFDGRFTNRFGAAYSNQHLDNRAPDDSGVLGAPTNNTGEHTAFDWRGDFKLMPGQTLVAGLQYQTDRMKSQTLTASDGDKSAFLEWQSNVTDRLFVTSNIRYDDDDSFGGHTTYRIAPAYLVPGTDTKLKASYGTGFKAPTLSELYTDYRPAFDFFGNPNLRPEQSKGYDLGLEQPLLNGRFRFGTTYFHNDIKNLIVTDVTGTTYANVGKATTSGFETFATAQLTPEFRLRSDYTFTLARDDVAHQELLRRPRHKVSLTGIWTPIEKASLSATLLYVGAREDGNRDFSMPRLRAQGAAIVNLAAEYKATDNLTVFGRIDNLFDKRYENPVGFLVPGLSAYAGVRVSM